jgi:hypothetical protein
MVFLGGAPAAIMITIFSGCCAGATPGRTSDQPRTYSWFPLIGGLAFHAVTDATGITASDGVFYLLVLGVFALSLLTNFSLIAGYTCYEERTSFASLARKMLFPVLSSEVAAATMAVGIAYLYHSVGIAAIALFGIVLFTFQYLLGSC